VVAFHGAMRLGAIWLGINRPLALPEKAALLAEAKPALVLAEPGAADDLASIDGMKRIISVDPAEIGDPWRAGLRSHQGAGRPPAVDPEAPAAIAYTSGTTGLPSGVVHSQRNMLLPAESLAVSRKYRADLRKGDCLPLTILNLMVLTTLLTSAAGGCCILTDRRDAYSVAEWIRDEQITVWNGVPALLYSMVSDRRIGDGWLSSLTELWTGGAACPEELIDAFTARFAVPVRATYGLTEAPSVVAIDPVVGSHAAGASGVPLPHLEVVVRDVDGNLLSANREGEICVRATSIGHWKNAYRPMLGLYSHDKLQPFDADELPTGDLGWTDDRGNVVVRDRKKLVIIRGGANVYPAEVERVLCKVPGVYAAVALGITDARLGQRVVAVVETDAALAPQPQAIIEFCRTQLAGYKVPERVVAVNALRRNSMGKVLRIDLDQLFR